MSTHDFMYGKGGKNTTFIKMKKKKKLKLPVVQIYAFKSNKMSAFIPFYGNMVIIYELEDKMCCISKLQIDRDF